MTSQGFSPSQRLGKWQEQYQNVLGEEMVRYGITLAEMCFLACTTLTEREPEELHPYPIPQEAILSITRFGARRRSRPPTAQPAEFATYILRRTLDQRGNPELLQTYLEALVGKEFHIDRWDFSRRLRARHQEAVQAAQKVTKAFLKRFTPQTLKQQALEAESFFKQTKAVYRPEWHEKGLKKVKSRLSLYQKMQREGFDRLDPFVDVRVRRQVGEFNFGGKNYSLEGKVSMNLLPGMLENPWSWAYLYGLPAWYPQWVTNFPVGQKRP